MTARLASRCLVRAAYFTRVHISRSRVWIDFSRKIDIYRRDVLINAIASAFYQYYVSLRYTSNRMKGGGGRPTEAYRT